MYLNFYRLNSKQEAIDIGLDTYFNDSSYCFVEWPSRDKMVNGEKLQGKSSLAFDTLFAAQCARVL